MHTFEQLLFDSKYALLVNDGECQGVSSPANEEAVNCNKHRSATTNGKEDSSGDYPTTTTIAWRPPSTMPYNHDPPAPAAGRHF